MEEKKKKRRFRFRRVDVVVLILLAILALVTIILNLMNAFGYALIQGDLYILLPAVILAVAVGWGAFALIRMIRHRAVRIAVGALAGVLLFLAVVVGMSYLSFAISVTTPQQYVTVRTEDGAHRLVVLRQLDTDEARIELRRAARLATDPDGDAEVTVDDWGYVYTAYEPKLGIF